MASLHRLVEIEFKGRSFALREYISVCDLAYSITMKETYDSMKSILQALNYPEHGWQICADLKVIGMVRGMHEIWMFSV